MSDVLEELKELEYRLKQEDYEIDHYEVREQSERSTSKGIQGKSLQRATGRLPLEVISEWGAFDSEDYVIEVFMGGDAPLDRLVYEPGKDLETISFSGKTYDVDIDGLLESD